MIHFAPSLAWPGLEAELLLGANCLPAVLLLLCKSNLGNIGGPRPVSQCSEGGYENQRGSNFCVFCYFKVSMSIHLERHMKSLHSS